MHRIIQLGSFFAAISLVLPIQAADWDPGDVFVGVANGSYRVFDGDGNFKEEISNGLGGFTTGCSFDNFETGLYTTSFSSTKVVVFDNDHPHDIVQVIDTAVASPGGDSESVVFDAAGNFYVGHPDGNDLIHKYDSAGVLVDTYSVAVDQRGTDWIELSSDQCTMFYTSEGRAVQRYNVCTDTQLSNFANLPGSGNAFALRLLPPGDGTGGLIVADLGEIKRLDGSGNVVQTYDVDGANGWFALNRDPSGTSFWSGDITTGLFYRFNIVSGALELGPVVAGGSTLAGICLKGELTPTEICDDGVDNDDDGLSDCDDSDCLGFPGCGGETMCANFMDDDDDQLIDCADPDCVFDFVCLPPVEVCNDMVDNDADNLVDCADPECINFPTCDEPVEPSCDMDGDEDVDVIDIKTITMMRGDTVEPGSPGDIDGDGVLTILDARKCVLQCDEENCAEVEAETRLSPTVGGPHPAGAEAGLDSEEGR